MTGGQTYDEDGWADTTLTGKSRFEDEPRAAVGILAGGSYGYLKVRRGMCRPDSRSRSWSLLFSVSFLLNSFPLTYFWILIPVDQISGKVDENNVKQRSKNW
jgi:hypothetical protein